MEIYTVFIMRISHNLGNIPLKEHGWLCSGYPDDANFFYFIEIRFV